MSDRTILHCVTQLQADSWEYRKKGNYDARNCDDVMLVHEADAELNALRQQRLEAQAEALEEAAEAYEAHNRYGKGFSDWLRARATALRQETHG